MITSDKFTIPIQSAVILLSLLLMSYLYKVKRYLDTHSILFTILMVFNIALQIISLIATFSFYYEESDSDLAHRIVLMEVVMIDILILSMALVGQEVVKYWKYLIPEMFSSKLFKWWNIFFFIFFLVCTIPIGIHSFTSAMKFGDLLQDKRSEFDKVGKNNSYLTCV